MNARMQAVAVAVVTTLAACHTQAQTFPVKPVRLVNPAAPLPLAG